jgi:hypothetical protein
MIILEKFGTIRKKLSLFSPNFFLTFFFITNTNIAFIKSFFFYDLLFSYKKLHEFCTKIHMYRTEIFIIKFNMPQTVSIWNEPQQQV